MINQKFITAFLASNPGLSEIAEMAYQLEDRSYAIDAEAKAERLHRGWNFTAGEFARAQSMRDTADELRMIILEAAANLFPPAEDSDFAFAVAEVA